MERYHRHLQDRVTLRMTFQEFRDAKTTIREGRQFGLVVLGSAAFFTFVLVVAPDYLKVIAGIGLLACVLCLGPILILTFGGCGCGHRSCPVCKFNTLAPEELARLEKEYEP